MSDPINDGGPVFPIQDASMWQWHGMTLRDYLAAKALPSVLEQSSVHNERERQNSAWVAYQIADAMLKARSKP